MEKLSLIILPNPFNRNEKNIISSDYDGCSLLELRDRYIPNKIKVIISLNGEIIEDDKLHLSKPNNGDCILFIPDVGDGAGGGGDEKSIIRSIAMLAIVLVAAYVAGPILGLGKFGFTAFLAVSTVAGGLLLNTIFPSTTSMPSTKQLPITPGRLGGADFDRSTTYSWNPQNTQQQGIPIPKIYGTNKMYGNVIAAHLESDYEKQYLNCLLSMGLGPVSRIYEFKLNDQPINNFGGIDVYTSYGNIDQDVLPNFNDTKVEYPLSNKISYGTPVNYTTQGSNFDGLEVELTFPRGIFIQAASGGLGAHSIGVKIEIRRQGAGETWYSISQQSSSELPRYFSGIWSAGYWVRSSDGTRRYWYEVQAGDTNYLSHKPGETYTDVSNPENPIRIIWRWMIGNEYIVQSVNNYFVMTDARAAQIFKMFKAYDLVAGKYEIKVTKTSQDQDSFSYGDDVYLTTIREVIYDDFEYPRHVLVGLRALATDQLSGSLRFSCLIDGLKIRVYDGASWSVEFNNNPAWVCFDMLTQPVLDNNLNVIRYDGINPSNLDIVKFKEWADWCDVACPDGEGGTEPRITFNGVFDYDQNLWEAALRVCDIGRAMLVWNGIKITVAIDKPGTISQLFTPGNISVDGFSETYLPQYERISEIEADFINSELDFIRDKFMTINENVDSAINKSNLQLFGLTKPSEVWRAIKRLLANNQYLIRSGELNVDIDAIACTVGDIIGIQSGLSAWDAGGRIISATSNTVTIDTSVTIEAGKSYEIMIRLSNDTIVTKNIADAPGVYTTLTVTSAFVSIPQKYDVYAFGEIAAELFRVLAVNKDSDNKVTLSVIDYNELIYYWDSQIPELPEYNVEIDLVTITPVYNLRLDELFIRGVDGAAVDVIDVYFDIPKIGPAYNHADIMYNTGAGWEFAGSCYTNKFRIYNVTVGLTYIICVLAVNAEGKRQDINEGPFGSITTLGKLDPPSDVQNFKVKQNGNFVDFTWDHIEDFDLWGYEIRQGSGWGNSRLIAAAIQHNSFSWQAEGDGTYTFLIKSIDESGIYSVNASTVNITLTGVSFNIVLTQDEITKGTPADGTKTNMIFVANTPAYLAIPFSLRWDDLESEKWDDTDVGPLLPWEPNYTGEYESNPIDIQKIADVNLNIQEVIDAVDPGATWRSYPSRTWRSYPSDTWEHITYAIEYRLYYSSSTNGVDYTSWIEYVGPVQVNFRYMKIKLVLTSNSDTGIAKIKNLKIILDVPDVEYDIENFAVASVTGSDVSFATYSLQFFSKVLVLPVVLGSANNIVPVISNKTLTGFHINLISVSGSKVSGNVDMKIKGW